MLKKQLEQGTLASTGTASGIAMPGAIPGVMVPPAPSREQKVLDNPHATQAMQSHYQQAVQQQDSPQQVRVFFVLVTCLNATLLSYTYMNHPCLLFGQICYSSTIHMGIQSILSRLQIIPVPQSTLILLTNTDNNRTVRPLPHQWLAAVRLGLFLPWETTLTFMSSSNMSKNDSHAVLMELFARDQDLVRQAAESARMKAAAAKGEQQPAPSKIGSSSKLAGVPSSMNSWPHFSSISSLNNLGQMTGVKSITSSFSGANLASQGNLNKMGNLAQIKSMESMGKNDSYAFLEVFFGDRGIE